MEYARGYRDALVDTWENIIKMVTKGYSSRELQIMSKTIASDARHQIETKISELEADFAQDEIIDLDEGARVDAPPARKKMESLKPGMSIMFREPRAAKCYQMFEKEIAGGMAGLCVSRSAPREIRDAYEIGKTQVIWLTNTEKVDMNLPPSALGLATDSGEQGNVNDEHMQPSALPMIYSMILNFLDGNRGGLVLIEGLEYLTSHNTFQSMLAFLQKVNEDVKRTGSRLIVSVNHSAFELKQFSHLETEMSQVV